MGTCSDAAVIGVQSQILTSSVTPRIVIDAVDFEAELAKATKQSRLCLKPSNGTRHPTTTNCRSRGKEFDERSGWRLRLG